MQLAEKPKRRQVKDLTNKRTCAAWDSSSSHMGWWSLFTTYLPLSRNAHNRNVPSVGEDQPFFPKPICVHNLSSPSPDLRTVTGGKGCPYPGCVSSNTIQEGAFTGLEMRRNKWCCKTESSLQYIRGKGVGFSHFAYESFEVPYSHFQHSATPFNKWFKVEKCIVAMAPCSSATDLLRRMEKLWLNGNRLPSLIKFSSQLTGLNIVTEGEGCPHLPCVSSAHLP